MYQNRGRSKKKVFFRFFSSYVQVPSLRTFSPFSNHRFSHVFFYTFCMRLRDIDLHDENNINNIMLLLLILIHSHFFFRCALYCCCFYGFMVYNGCVFTTRSTSMLYMYGFSSNTFMKSHSICHSHKCVCTLIKTTVHLCSLRRTL